MDVQANHLHVSGRVFTLYSRHCKHNNMHAHYRLARTLMPTHTRGIDGDRLLHLQVIILTLSRIMLV